MIRTEHESISLLGGKHWRLSVFSIYLFLVFLGGACLFYIFVGGGLFEGRAYSRGGRIRRGLMKLFEPYRFKKVIFNTPFLHSTKGTV